MLKLCILKENEMWKVTELNTEYGAWPWVGDMRQGNPLDGVSDLRPSFSEEWVLQSHGGREFQAEEEKKT